MAKWLEYARIAGRQALRKRARLLLTALGIAIGVAAVVGIVSLGEGIRCQSVAMIEEQSDLALIEVTAGLHGGTIVPITASKTASIASLPHVQASAPVVKAAFATRQQTYLGVVGGRWDEMVAVFDPVLHQGRGYRAGSADAVIGRDLADQLLRYEGIRPGDTFGVLVREYGESGLPEDREGDLAAVGILQERDDALDTAVLMDAATVTALAGERDTYDAVYVRVDSPENVFSVVEGIEGLGLNANGAFEEIESVNNLMDVVILVLSSFTGISLVVGALMIVNTMIISVFERMREIGITMAVGASQSDVVGLILLECLYIGIIGGLIGDLMGIGFAAIINTVGRSLILDRLGANFAGFAEADITLITPQILAAGMLIAVLLSLLAGIYPALKAARLNPVEAIRQM
ncbi:ABC transporter permease [Methanoculleus sp. FWC-SCC1]|uniref:ABC transporter permease n=2 Tax=Methanoculleus frigidifontis TaxID=2584085 RepID=A0ABT8M802_9EURY|nr:ABC transporter permease [Methanoculleus sp. FWC-SCC1]